MRVVKTSRGFDWISHPTHASEPQDTRLVSASSAIDFNTPDGLDRPGTSYLWIGDNHHLNRKEVRRLIKHLQAWLDTGSLKVKAKAPAVPSPAGIKADVGSEGVGA